MAIHYHTENKQEAREFLLQNINSPPSWILTLPDVNALCAIEFKKKWKDSKIIGVCNNRIIVRDSTLVEKNILDEYYFGDILQLAVDNPILKKKAYEKSKGINTYNKENCIPVLKDTDTKLGEFDLLFLDFTMTPKENNIEKIKLFVEKYAKIGSTIGVTFTRDRTDNIMDDQLSNIEKKVLSPFPEYELFLYKNARSNMMLLKWNKQ